MTDRKNRRRAVVTGDAARRGINMRWHSLLYDRLLQIVRLLQKNPAVYTKASRRGRNREEAEITRTVGMIKIEAGAQQATLAKTKTILMHDRSTQSHSLLILPTFLAVSSETEKKGNRFAVWSHRAD